MLGGKNVGKTTILGVLSSQNPYSTTCKQLGQIVTTANPTENFTVEKASLITGDWNLAITSFAVGEGSVSTPRHYYQGVQGLIFVVDSTDRDGLDMDALHIEKMLEEHRLANGDDLKDAPLLVYANKKDLPNAIGKLTRDGKLKEWDTSDIEDRLRLKNISKGRKWFVQYTCALHGGDALSGFLWLEAAINNKHLGRWGMDSDKARWEEDSPGCTSLPTFASVS